MTRHATWTALSPQEARRMLDKGHAVLIDVREIEEYVAGHISGALHVPLSALEQHDLNHARAAGMAAIFQCRSGRRTTVNKDRLIALGFSQNYELEGGIDAWKAAGLPCR